MSIGSKRAGYVQGIDYAGLVALAEAQGVCARVERRPGDFVDRDRTLVMVHAKTAIADEDHRKWRGPFTIGSRKTDLQDLQFGFDELDEIATRALSPGINDPFTAIACIDWMGAALSEYDRAMLEVSADPPPSRIAVTARSFEDYLAASFGRLRQHAAADACVTAAVARTLAGLAANATVAAHRSSLHRERARFGNGGGW